ncbi:MAG TPA: MaoC family dehydratase N-terminal domain-containing protein [Streptosporangiaceae bacterium]|nr:MaoC family dehydratase N-terminal domain-containing protein [Streptosporangiaceae bacterium]
MTGLSEMIAGWAPEPAEATETITAGPAIALSGLLDREPAVTGPGDPIPPLWHWLYFLDGPATSDLGPDGHPAAGHFMPPIPERRRMYAGGRASYAGAIRCGDEITRRSELADATVKQGRTGELLFVTVRSVFTRAGAVLATEEQDLVYRSGPPLAGATGPRRPVPGEDRGPWRIQIVPDPVLLFRFSALTYNAHRIHYDADYATAVEGHPGLVVHGPLLALLCFELPRRHAPRHRVTQLSFRARSPVYVGQRCTVTGGPSGDGGARCAMAVTGPDGAAAVTAEGRLSA